MKKLESPVNFALLCIYLIAVWIFFEVDLRGMWIGGVPLTFVVTLLFVIVGLGYFSFSISREP